jgi:hypothetical protein
MPLTDIIIARPEEAAAINDPEADHLEQWDCLESKRIDTIKLDTLAEIVACLTAGDGEAAATFKTGDVLHQRSDEGPWIYLVPDLLTSALAALDADAEESVAAKWAETEEFQLDRWQAVDVEDYLHDLIVYARKAREAGKSLLLWMSL